MNDKIYIYGDYCAVMYVGEYKDDKWDGMGALYRTDGSVIYKGEYKAGKRHGMGTLYRRDGSIIYKGEYKDDKMDRIGVIYDLEGIISYEGEFIEDSYDGLGTMYIGDGSIFYKGEWKDSDTKSVLEDDLSKSYSGDKNLNNTCIINEKINALHEEISALHEKINILNKKIDSLYIITKNVKDGSILYNGERDNNISNLLHKIDISDRHSCHKNLNGIDNINEKIDAMYDCINEMGGIIDLPWCDKLLYPYYNHFDDKSNKYKLGSLTAFWGLLQEWDDGSGFPFYTDRKNHTCYDFQKYMEVFMAYSSKIKSSCPSIYRVIIGLLMKLDKNENLKDTFPTIDITFINKIRDTILNEEIKLTEESFRYAYAEARCGCK
ncbi:MORN repeat-containing protein [Clostridium tagluense]|uniref:hypothetical protein n=1 Tax=Clostridium tagluense TaxID=360422 RepID=UPI001CF1DA5E|nr:hypothetical protein [Clostridium tagluense]MCB2299502.1 hypothetical protein [Clostridium tagluense]